MSGRGFTPRPLIPQGLGGTAGVGFEPTGALSSTSGFQDRPIRPLWHPAGQPSVGGAPNSTSDGGTVTDPSSFWKFSTTASAQRSVTAVPFSVCTYSVPPFAR